MVSKKSIRNAIIGLLVIGMLWGTQALINAEPKEELPYICVKGILFDNDVPMALVNQGIVRVGGTVAGATVTQIDSSTVQFEYKGETFERRLGDCSKSVEHFYEGAVSTEALPTLPSSPTQKEQQQEDPDSLYENFRDGVANVELDKEQAEQIARVMAGAMAGMRGVVALFWLALYVYSAITLQFIARKTGTENGWLAWIPIGNLYLMCRVAGKPAWWVVLFFVPIANLIVCVMICLGIAQARNKPAWLGILLFVPIVNLFILGYLAFSKDAVILEEKIVQKPDTQKPDVQKPEVPKPDVPKPDTQKPDTQNPDDGPAPRSTGITL